MQIRNVNRDMAGVSRNHLFGMFAVEAGSSFQGRKVSFRPDVMLS